MKKLIAFLILIVMLFSCLKATLGDQINPPNGTAKLLENKPDNSGEMHFQQFGLNKARQAASRSLQSWLGKFGTAKVDLTGSDFQSGSIDVFVPLYNTTRHLFFTQVGVRRAKLMTPTYRTTMNVGAGYRDFTDVNWMLGVNAFFDSDLPGQHQRIGVGAEAWTDFFKLASNAYVRLSDWQTSSDLSAYDERPANGIDIRAEGYFPRYPQFGGKLMFEQYFDDEVGLFGVANRQMNPAALTIGAVWTPVSLLNVSLDHRMGQGGSRDTTFKIAFNFAIGVPLHAQLRSNNVAPMRTLKCSRYRLVDRNNAIVLAYKKRRRNEIKLPASISGIPLSTITFPVTVKSDATLKNFTWAGSFASFALPYTLGNTAITLPYPDGNASVVLPTYTQDGRNDYGLQLLATDRFGRTVKSNMMKVTVEPLALSITRSKAVAIANGNDTVTFTARLLSTAAVPIANRKITWTVRNATRQSSTDVTDTQGNAFAVISSAISAVAEIDAFEVTNNSKATSTATFAGDTASAHVVSLTASPVSIAANGATTSMLTATVADANGNAVGAGVAVNWSTSLGSLAAASTKTNASSVATVVLTSGTTAGTANLTAKGVSGDAGQSTTVTLTADTSTARVSTLTASPTSIAANGWATSTLTATVTDANGNALGAGLAVHWTSSLGTLASAATTTNANGVATVVLTSDTTIGTTIVHAHAASDDAGQSVAVMFIDASETRNSSGNQALLLIVAATQVSTGTISFYWNDLLIGTASYAGYANQSCANVPHGFPPLVTYDATYTISSCSTSNAGAGYTMYIFGLTRTPHS